jgi:hypothetical protein
MSAKKRPSTELQSNHDLLDDHTIRQTKKLKEYLDSREDIILRGKNTNCFQRINYDRSVNRESCNTSDICTTSGRILRHDLSILNSPDEGIIMRNMFPLSHYMLSGMSENLYFQSQVKRLGNCREDLEFQAPGEDKSKFLLLKTHQLLKFRILYVGFWMNL